MAVLDIPKIRNRIKVAHEGFVNSVGMIPAKISADHQMMLSRMDARIGAIMSCFIEEKIIDKAESDYKTDLDRSCFCYKLSKNGYEKNVKIWTDGINIRMKSNQYPLVSGLNFEEDVIIKDIDFENYNWLEFVDQLLHFIHKVIYSRKQSIEKKIFG